MLHILHLDNLSSNNPDSIMYIIHMLEGGHWICGVFIMQIPPHKRIQLIIMILVSDNENSLTVYNKA